MIARIWHGWTTPENANIYEELLKTEILPGIEAKRITGFLGVELLRRESDDEVEFVTIMHFDAIESVKQFVGDDYRIAYVPDKARAVLARYDDRAVHYDVVQR